MLRAKKVNDPSRFDGEGVVYRAKLIGIEDVKESRGDQMCQEALIKLKNSVRISGGHKRKIIININRQGIKITDAISMTVLHSHAVKQISFISRDTTDNRAFGYICEIEDGLRKFFAIKTSTTAEQVVMALKDLFQVVFEAKKKDSDQVKEKDQEETNAVGDKENLQASETPSTPESGQAVVADAASPEVPVQPVMNLFDFGDQSANIAKEAPQRQSLELEFLTDNVALPVTSPVTSTTSPPVATATTIDPWGISAVEAPPSKSTSSSALDDLAGLQTGFSTSFSLQTGFGSSSSFTPPVAGLMATKDPFGSNPFNSFGQQSPVTTMPGLHQQNQSFSVGFGSPFGSELHQPFGIQGAPPQPGAFGAYNLFPGMVPHGVTSPVMAGGSNPFGSQQLPAVQPANPFGNVDSNLQTTKNGKPTSPDSLNIRAKSPQDDLFGDLLDIKMTSPTRAKSPGDMFAQILTTEKKSINELIAASPRASPVPSSWAKPATASPRASPVPAALLKPTTASPRASPVPTALLKPAASPRASPVQSAPGLLPQTSPAAIAQEAPTQDAFLDDFFGGSANQVSEKSLFD